MNDLQQAKKLLEDKISLTKGNIERKKKEFDRLQKEAEETNEIIVTLKQELWKDEFALEAVNEEISKIPTLNCSREKLFKTIKETSIIALIFLLPLFSNGQDTIHARKVKLAENVGTSMKTGKALYAHPRWRKVKSGIIIKKSENDYLINGKEYHPGDHKPLKIKK